MTDRVVQVDDAELWGQLDVAKDVEFENSVWTIVGRWVDSQSHGLFVKLRRVLL